MFNLGMGEITVILLLALIFLGPQKLPELATSLGKLIRELRKVTSDVKNEINLDESFRKPFQDLHDAVTLHPDELKRRDEMQKAREEAARRAAEEMAKFAAENPAGLTPPDGLTNPVVPDGVIHSGLESTAPAGATGPAAKLPVPNGPNDTIVQPAPPRAATLDDIPTPPPETGAVKPTPPPGTGAVKPTPPPETGAVKPPGLPPAGTIARAASIVAPPARASDSNVTQILKEEDLIPSASSGAPPPPPHLPGLRPSAPRPVVVPPAPPMPPAADKKKP
ncbi:MAG TPA: twin-arginine translocase TatA/TatE family subunit [Polyangia bacterium]|nr:twin-arginine translocase TatA/TatE family subunit [Polyangia bacterium]